MKLITATYYRNMYNKILTIIDVIFFLAKVCLTYHITYIVMEIIYILRNRS